MKNLFLILISGYAVLLGAGRYSIYTVTIFFFLVLCLVVLYRGTVKVKSDILVYLVFAVYSVISISYADYKWGALLFSSSILCGALLYTVLRNSEGWEKNLLYTLLICGVANGVFGIYQTIDQAVVSGFFYDKNAYSGFLTPLIPVSIYLQVTVRKRYLAYVTSFLVFSNLLSNSRAGICTAILAVFVIVLYLWRHGKREHTRNLVFTVCSGIIAYFIFSYIAGLFSSPIPGLTEKAVDASVSRFYIYDKAFKAFLSAPIFGSGMFSFQGMSLTFINPFTMYKPITVSHAHNIFLNILVELGVVGFLIFAGFLFIVIRGPFDSRGFYFKIALLSFFLHNMYEYNFTAPPFQLLLAVLAALVMEEKGKERGEEPDIIRLKGWTKDICLYVLLCFFAFVYMSNVIGYLYTEKARTADKNYKYLAYSAYFGYLLSGAQENLASYFEKAYLSSGKTESQLFDAADKYYLRALALDRFKGDLYIKIAKFYYRAGKKEVAGQYLLRAIRLFPYQPVYKYEYAKYYSSMGRYDESIKILLDVDGFFRRYSAAAPFRLKVLNELALDYRETGDMKSYNEYADKAGRLARSLKVQP